MPADSHCDHTTRALGISLWRFLSQHPAFKQIIAAPQIFAYNHHKNRKNDGFPNRCCQPIIFGHRFALGFSIFLFWKKYLATTRMECFWKPTVYLTKTVLRTVAIVTLVVARQWATAASWKSYDTKKTNHDDDHGHKREYITPTTNWNETTTTTQPTKTQFWS